VTRRCLRRPVPGQKRQYRLWLYLVEPTVIVIPAWAQALQPKEFDVEPRRAWLPRIAAKIIREQDRDAGGRCSVIKTEYKRCGVCGRLAIQLLAEQRRQLDRGEPCGPDCKRKR
jgi:hypothetical protein